jgi:hypothetical protein
MYYNLYKQIATTWLLLFSNMHFLYTGRHYVAVLSC